MEKIELEIATAFELLKDSLGKKYTLYASSHSENPVFCVTGGIIKNVWQDLKIELEDGQIERFTISRMKSVEVTENIIKVTYLDNSYFKIYITEREGK